MTSAVPEPRNTVFIQLSPAGVSLSRDSETGATATA